MTGLGFFKDVLKMSYDRCCNHSSFHLVDMPVFFLDFFVFLFIILRISIVQNLDEPHRYISAIESISVRKSVVSILS